MSENIILSMGILAPVLVVIYVKLKTKENTNDTINATADCVARYKGT